MRTPVNSRRIALAVVTPLLLAGLVGCGSDEDSPSADSSPTSSSSPTAATDTSAPETTAGSEPTVGEKVDPQEFAALISAGLDAATTAEITMSVTSTELSMSATGHVDYSGDFPAMALSMTAPALGDGVIDMRLVDRVMYMSVPMVDTNKTFYRIDLSDPDNPLADSLGTLTSFDPKSTMEMFTKGLKSVTFIGDETVRGDQTAHYRVTTSTESLEDSLGGTTTGADLPDVVSYDVWLDADNRMRKMKAEVGKQSTLEMEMFNWGEPVSIEAPPDSQVQDLPTG